MGTDESAMQDLADCSTVTNSPGSVATNGHRFIRIALPDGAHGTSWRTPVRQVLYNGSSDTYLSVKERVG